QIGYAPIEGKNYGTHASLLTNLGRAEFAGGDSAAAIQCLVQANEIYDEMKAMQPNTYRYEMASHAACCNNLALVHIFRNEFEQARKQLDEALKLTQPGDTPLARGYSTTLTTQALLHVSKDQLRQARTSLESARDSLLNTEG